MIFWIGFFVMFFNERFVMMIHDSPWFSRLRDKLMKRLGDKGWWRLHGTLDYTWMGLVTLGLIVNSNRVSHLIALGIFWGASFLIFYFPRYIKRFLAKKYPENISGS